jgi:hypothetical protein
LSIDEATRGCTTGQKQEKGIGRSAREKGSSSLEGVSRSEQKYMKFTTVTFGAAFRLLMGGCLSVELTNYLR